MQITAYLYCHSFTRGSTKSQTQHLPFLPLRQFQQVKKMLLIMRLTVILVLAACLEVSAGGYAQQITLKAKDMPCESVFREISRQSGYQFFFNKRLIRNARNVSVELNAVPVEKAIEICFSNQPFDFAIINKTVVIRKKERHAVVKPETDAIPPVTIRGKITDEQGNPLPGATVRVKRTNATTVANEEGVFTLEANTDDRLEFSFVGFETREIVVTNAADLQVILKAVDAGLSEVVVVGYGTQKKVNLTGSVSTISKDDIVKRQVGQTSMVLQGIAPGVTVTQPSGQPGKDGGTIRIRGVGTLGDANPLVLVDGVPSNINNIDPNDIESITVLKDAASSSIYGSRAANGVILVTTKRASDGKFSISYSGYTGWQKPTDLKKRVNAVDHMKLINLANTNIGNSPIFSNDLILKYDSLNKVDPVAYPNTDWFKEVYTESGFTQNHFLNFNGGTDKVKIMGALGYFDQKAIFINTGFKRYTFRLNSDIKISAKLKVKADIFLRYAETNEPGGGVESVLFNAEHLSSLEPTVNEFGFAAPSTSSNPLALLHKGYNRTMSPFITTTLGFKYDFTDDLNFEFNYAPQFTEDDNKTFKKIVDVYYSNGNVFAPGSQIASLVQRSDKSLQTDLWANLNYKKLIGNHHFKLLLGGSQEAYHQRWYSAFRDNYVLPQFDVLNAGGSANQQANGSGYDWALRSLFGRLNYDFSGKYLFEANLRYDGSSRFAEGRKYGSFPSFSAGWRLSEEEFWTPVRSFVNDFKLRVSYGQLGNQNIGTYPYDAFLTTTINVFNGFTINGLTPQSLANPDISWEKTKMLDIGADISIRQNLSLTFDYYHKRTEGILLRLDIPAIIGLDPPYQNAGIVENKGWDLGINYRGNYNKLKYNFNASVSDVKIKVIDLRGVNIAGLVVNFEGYPMNSFYGYEAIGYFQTEDEIDHSPQQFGKVIPGSIKYKDMDKNGVINGDDRKIIGNGIPRYTYNLNINLEWKGIDFSLFGQGVGKADGYLYGTAVWPFNNGSTALEMHKDYWTPENPNAKFPSLAFNSSNDIQNSTFWLKNASYLRIKNLQIGYTLPDRVVKMINIRKIRVYASGQNLMTFDKFWSGFDVEAPVGDGTYYPQQKTYSIGINLNF